MAVIFPATISSIPNPLSRSTKQHSKAHPIDSLLHYYKMLARGFSPNAPTFFISALRDCARHADFVEGQSIHAQIIKTGSRLDRFVATSLIRFYSSCGHISSARQLFDEITKKDVALHTAMLMGYARNGAIENARHIFDEMPERDIVAWNAMLSGYAQIGLAQDALDLFHEMQIGKFRPNEVTLVGCRIQCVC